jgi:hypothetical protein
LKPVVLAAVGAGISYLIKNLLTNSDDEILTMERGGSTGGSGGVSRILILIVILSGLSMYASAQHPTPREVAAREAAFKKEVNPWQGFFKPVDKSLLNLSYALSVEENKSVWLFRPTVEVSALQLIPSKVEGKVFDVSSFQSVGMGLSYQHFISYNGQPYNNYGFNLLLLFDAIPRETTTLNLSFAGTVSFLEFMNFGAGYNLGMKKPFILTGLTYNFN